MYGRLLTEANLYDNILTKSVILDMNSITSMADKKRYLLLFPAIPILTERNTQRKTALSISL